MRDLRFFRGTLPPQRSVRRENCLSAKGASIFRQRSESKQGRKNVLSAEESPYSAGITNKE